MESRMSDALNPLLGLSDQLASLAEAGAGHVVTVRGRSEAPASGILWQQDLVATALPALARLEDIAVVLPFGRQVLARLVGRDPLSGIALLRAETGPATPVVPADRPALAPGRLVLALGRAGGAPVAACGIVARADGTLDLRLPAAAEGGPVFAADGGLLGMALLDGEGQARLVPASAIAALAGLVAQRGRAGRGYLGLAMQAVRGGILVLGVDPGSTGARAGLLLGDVLLTANGAPLAGIRDLLAHLPADQVGRPLALELQRGGQPMRLNVIIGERPGLAG
jgi:S1-C subfamily serine protease